MLVRAGQIKQISVQIHLDFRISGRETLLVSASFTGERASSLAFKGHD